MINTLNIGHKYDALKSAFSRTLYNLFGLPVYGFLKVVDHYRPAILIIATTLYLFTMTPFLFTDLATGNFRVAVSVISALFLLGSTKRLTPGHMVLFGSISVWVFLFIVTSDAINFEDRVHRIMTTSAIYLWAILLHRSLFFNQSMRTMFVAYYTRVTGLLALFSILSMVYYVLFGEYFFSIDLTNNYHYLLTPFGALLPKNFLGIDCLRCFSYFAEPVFASVIFSGNFFISKQSDSGNLNPYRMISLAAGILSFSYAFYLFLFYFYLITRRKKIHLGYVLIPLVALIFYDVGDELMSASSMDKRSLLVELFLSEVRGWGVFEWLFGMTNSAIQEIHFSAGLMQLTWDYGLLGLVVYFLLVYIVSNQSYRLIGAIFITTMVVDPSICPIYYLMLAVFAVILPSQEKKNTVEPY